MVGGVRSGESGRIILDCCSTEGLAPARGVEHVQFIRRTGQGADLAGAPDAPEGLKGGGLPAGRPFLLILRELGIDEVHGDSLNAKFPDIGEAGEGTGSVFVIRGVGIARTSSIDKFIEG